MLAADVIANAADTGATVKDNMGTIGWGDFDTRSIAADAELIRIRRGNRTPNTPKPKSVRSIFHWISFLKIAVY